MNNQKEISSLLIEAYQKHLNEQIDEAEKDYKKILIIDPYNFDANNLLGALYVEKKEYLKAKEYLIKSTSIKKDNYHSFNNLGITLKELGQPEEAIKKLDLAINIDPNRAEAYHNCGEVYLSLNNFDLALKYFNNSIKLKKDFTDSYENIAFCLYKSHKLSEALEIINFSLNLNLTYRGLCIKADILLKQGKYKEAIINFEIALKKKDLGTNLIKYISAKCFIFDWDKINELKNILIKNINDNISYGDPFLISNLIDCPEILKKNTELYTTKNIGHIYSKNKKNDYSYKNEKINIGYFSADFIDHATAHLITGLLEKHDKNKFNIFGFSLINLDEKKNFYTDRISKAIKIIDISNKTISEVKNLCSTLKIDIAVDLHGFTSSYSRIEIFCERIAPIQINYLGYPGTVGPNIADYIIADSKIIPHEYQNYYFEKIIYLPHSYQVNDDQQKISEKKFSRKELSLPDGSFVFSCFNNTLKITPEIFKTWVNILDGVENSVLWLYDCNVDAKNNLLNLLNKNRINSNRIIFANPLQINNHLSRIQNADLFLDTFPYNAHTTARDFLWAGVPVLTLCGKTFASRVGYSLLSSLELNDELVCFDLKEYEQKAIMYGNNKIYYKEIKKKLIKNRTDKYLFNTDLFTKNIEIAYTNIYQKYLNKEAIDHIFI